MYEKISERSEGACYHSLELVIGILTSCVSRAALDDKIDGFAEIVQKHYNITDLGDPAASTEVR